ncbi:MAG: isochorismate synthase [Desulfobacterales bacterium]|nr:isochorismate synthase [Desulfobacterales bacterium]
MKAGTREITHKDIRNQVNRFLPGIRDAARNGGPLPLLVTCKTDPVDILQWLKSHSVYPRLYWYDRAERVEIGGYGSLMTFSENDPARFSTALGKLSGVLDEHPQGSLLRFLGGRCFGIQEKQGEIWEHFPHLWFVLPEVMIFRNTGDFFVSVGVPVEGREDAHEDANDIVAGISKSLEKAQARDLLRISTQFPEIITRTDHPDYAGWKHNINTCLHEIESGGIDKVVLARRTDVAFRGAVDAVDYLHALKKNNNRCYCFLLQPRRRTAFLGATPERLFKIEKDMLISEAVSGTVARGADPNEDRDRRAWLLKNQKELSEHRFVTDDLVAKFHQLTERTDLPETPEVLKLANVQHLVSSVSGVLRNGVSIGKIVSGLHPTAAVGGYPLSAALDLIEKLEPFGRGWYAGPVGIISRKLTEMAVGIRSCLLNDKVVSLFAGSGIVRGSTPESEWQEIEEKMSTAFKVLSGGPG